MVNQTIFIIRTKLAIAVLKYFKKNVFYIFYNFSLLKKKWWQLKYFFEKDKLPFILHIQYHGCWCPGNGRSQGISSPGIDLDLQKYSGFSMGKVNLFNYATIILCDGTWIITGANWYCGSQVGTHLVLFSLKKNIQSCMKFSIHTVMWARGYFYPWAGWLQMPWCQIDTGASATHYVGRVAILIRSVSFVFI